MDINIFMARTLC